MNEVEEIKARLDIVDFINHYVTLKKAGSNYKALCPFHQEKTPSFMVSGEKQIFKCFGCGQGGDVIEFLMKYENLNFGEALELLAQKTGVTLRRQKTREPANSLTGKSTLYQINMATAQLWHKILMTHPTGKQALQYLRGRRMNDGMLNKFLIGYAPSQEITRTFLNKRGFSAQGIKAAGSPDKFFRRIMFPLFDVIGNVVGFTGRATAKDQEPKYLNTPETSLFYKSRYLYGLNFAKQAIKKLDRTIVVEGQMDVVLSHQAGVTNVVATSGTALTRDHLAILARYSPNIVFAFDNDEAGLKATKSALDLALDLELTVRVIEMPNSLKDVGEVVEKAPEKWLKTASQPLPWLEFLLHQFPAAFSLEDKKKAAREILPFLARVKDPIEQAYWTKRLAALLNVKEEAVASALEKFKAQSSKVKTEKPKITKIALSSDEELYGLLVSFPQFQKAYTDLFNQLKKWYNKDSKPLELEIKIRYDKADEQAIAKAIDDLVSRRFQAKLEQLKDDFARQIAAAEAAGDREKVKQLFIKLQETLQKK